MMKRKAHGRAIRAIRLAKGFPAARFAVACMISDSHLHNIESGHRDPSPDVLVRIAAQLGEDVEAISYEVSMEAAA